MFENKISHNGIFYSRYIASWTNEGGNPGDSKFVAWLIQTGCTADEAHEIRNLATNGKLELETNAMMFLKKNENEEFDC